MEQKYFSEMLPALASRASVASVSWLGFSNVPLRRHLAQLFSQPYGNTGSFLADPAFEAVFGWKSSHVPMSDLVGTLLSKRLVDAMDNPPPELAEQYRFDKSRSPYSHQLQAWKILELEPPRSLVVTSGTGSGKTECFMVPILERLIREQEKLQSPLVGVRALFLYPLNALINSQRERLQAWTDSFGRDIRYCLYNGITPDVVPADRKITNGSEIQDRKTLRASPPPILVTNATMLEYMLVRTQDAGILAASQGKLEWIVLDEAHSYIGSQAAELALLIRRVLHGFGVRAANVRFVATSATIGDPDGEAGVRLKDFLAQVAGVDASRVELVAGSREIPALPTVMPTPALSISELWKFDPDEPRSSSRFRALAENSIALALRRLFTTPDELPVARLSDVCKTVHGSASDHSMAQQLEALSWLDLLTGTVDENETPFLPLRAHLFHQTLAGLWCCADSACPAKTGSSLDDPTWPFGQLFLAPRNHCVSTCAAPVYELVVCDDCGDIFLDAQVSDGKVTQSNNGVGADEFQLDIENPETSLEADLESDTPASPTQSHRILISNRIFPETDVVHIHRRTMQFVESGTDEALRIVAHEDGGDGLQCPACGAKAARNDWLFRHARIGGPFLLGGLLPTMLEFAPDGDQAADRPYRGRRMLTFSDSRQGTARMAAKLQQDAERTKMRGLIYHHVLRKSMSGSIADDKLNADIGRLERLLADPAMSSDAKAYLRDDYEEKRKQLLINADPTPMSFVELKDAIGNEGGDFKYIQRTYSAYSRSIFGGATGASQLAGMFLVRELGRRPKRHNSLETMGLISVRYSSLEKVTKAPPDWSRRGHSLADWKDFLKIALDYFVRNGGSLSIPQDWRDWIGIRFPQSWIVSPLTVEWAKGQRRWPLASTSGLRSTLVRLMAYVLKADMSTPLGKDTVDSMMLAGWDDITSILTLSEGGYFLPPDDLAFAPISKAWICPITRRILDTTLCGVTPYLPRIMRHDIAVCEAVAIPIYDSPFGGTTDGLERIQRARTWMAKQSSLSSLRESGVWSNINDRVIELAPYFSAAEHSAQQPAELLGKYEKQFKDGWINLLSCSTTMEMGIDIGGIQTVGMNNVPPHPANYLQRAGRAGRRRETRSTAITLCKSNPHDQNVFLDTRWAFVAKLPPPVVSLNSAVIVQRHINAMVLAEFLKNLLRTNPQDLSKLTCGWFFGDDRVAPSNQFMGWCGAFAAAKQIGIAAGLQDLVKRSIFEGQTSERFVRQSGVDMSRTCARWMAEWKALLEQEVAFGATSATDPALKAIGFQKRRLSDEYLLRELATQGFLPAYGFPTSIASFDNMTVSAAKNLPPVDVTSTKSRDDNRFMKRDLASRDLVTALREYAPGSEIVMDGLVYESAGITLNWHIPATQQDANETQAIKFAWRCTQCGASGTTHSLQMANHCNACGEATRNPQRFLEPAGFSVDFYSSPDNDLSRQRFVPVERPWISARGDWSPLTNPRLGRVRATPDGHVYHHSAGVHGKGYALCLACGRAEPMLPNDVLPKQFEEGETHKKLRSRKDDRICSGSTNRFAIKAGIVLGHQVRTDVLELQIRDETGIWVTDRVVARTMVVVLRDALAALLGVQARELGCDVQEMQNDEGTKCQSLFIFDQFAAGYTSGAEHLIDQMFKAAADRLHCVNNCDSCCPQCVLDFDQRFDAENLDRHAALRVMTPTWLNLMKLPEDMQYLGPNSKVESTALSQAVLHTSGHSDVTCTRLYANASFNSADIATSTLRHLTYRLAALSRPVEIAVEQPLLDCLTEADRYTLASLADQPGVTVLLSQPVTVTHGAAVIATVQRSDSIVAWATLSHNALTPNADWGTSTSPLIRGNLKSTQPHGRILTASEIRPPRDNGDREIVLHHELDGELDGFGQRFWAAVRSHHSTTAQLLANPTVDVVAIEYRDRYLFTPVAAALVIQLVSGLREIVGRDRWDNPVVAISTTGRRDGPASRAYGTLFADWPDTQVRDAVVKAALAYVGLDGKLVVQEKFDLSHGRSLAVRLSNGKQITVRLDQGVSYWRVCSPAHNVRKFSTWFDFAMPVSQQASMVAEMAVPLEGGALPTEVFVKTRDV